MDSTAEPFQSFLQELARTGVIWPTESSGAVGASIDLLHPKCLWIQFVASQLIQESATRHARVWRPLFNSEATNSPILSVMVAASEGEPGFDDKDTQAPAVLLARYYEHQKILTVFATAFQRRTREDRPSRSLVIRGTEDVIEETNWFIDHGVIDPDIWSQDIPHLAAVLTLLDRKQLVEPEESTATLAVLKALARAWSTAALVV